MLIKSKTLGLVLSLKIVTYVGPFQIQDLHKVVKYQSHFRRVGEYLPAHSYTPVCQFSSRLTTLRLMRTYMYRNDKQVRPDGLLSRVPGISLFNFKS